MTNNNSNIIRKAQRNYFYIFCLALLLRLVFCFYLQKYYWGEFKFVLADTSSFLDSFTNLINNGHFCNDLSLRDSCFYRQPTYPFFIGVNYLLFGKLAWISVSILQSVIDALSCCLAVAISRSLNFGHIAQKIIAVLFVTYPFTIVWTPIQYAETLGVFLVLLAVLIIVDTKNIVYAVVGAGIVLVMGAWTKQYIVAILTAITFLVAARPDPKKIISITLAIYISFSFFYSPWIIRNYVSYGQLAPFSGKTNGLKVNGLDWSAVFNFLSIFYENNTPYVYKFLETGELVLPHSKFVKAHREEIDTAASFAYNHGSSYLLRRPDKSNVNIVFNLESKFNYDQEIFDKFSALKRKAKQEMSFLEYYRTSFEMFQKSIFKTTFTQSWGISVVQSVLFGYRGFLIILGLSALAVSKGRVRWFVCAALVYWLSTVFVLSFVLRHLEMRYLLMADSILLICSGLTVEWFVVTFLPWIRMLQLKLSGKLPLLGFYRDRLNQR